MGMRRLTWRIPFCATLAAIVVFAPLIASINGLDFLYLFLVVPGLIVLGITALIYAAVKRELHIVVMVVVFWAASAFLFLGSLPVHLFAKWLLKSHEYKSEVLAQPDSANGELKHIEYDGWGWAGQDTSVFLVFDPTDSLSGPAKNAVWGKVNGIPCEVSQVRRMQSHWYLVFFDGFVDQSSWRRCK
jgi:hypothetical protein